MKYLIPFLVVYFLLLVITASFGQSPSDKKVVITGVRFAYPLVKQWIRDYQSLNPAVEITIDPRTNADPATYDLLIEAYDAEANNEREYVYLARYAVVPIANSTSDFAQVYVKKGLNESAVKTIFFHSDFTADEEVTIKPHYNVYTRLQKAGAPGTFAHYFGFEQKNISGKGIAGADEHLISSVRKDSVGVSYAPLNLLYDPASGKSLDGVAIIPVDLNGNGRVSDDERIYSSRESVLARFNEMDSKPLKNLPTEYLHFSVRKDNGNAEAAKFLNWVQANVSRYLGGFGFINLDATHAARNHKI